MSEDVSPHFKWGKIEGIDFEKLNINDDGRGHLVELFRDDFSLPQPVMAYLSVTKKDVVRGPHEHKDQTDIFIFCQSTFQVYLWDMRPESPTYLLKMEAITDKYAYTKLIIPPRVVHAYKACDLEGGTVINCPNRLYAGWNREEQIDEIRHEEDPTSPFTIEP